MTPAVGRLRRVVRRTTPIVPPEAPALGRDGGCRAPDHPRCPRRGSAPSGMTSPVLPRSTRPVRLTALVVTRRSPLVTRTRIVVRPVTTHPRGVDASCWPDDTHRRRRPRSPQVERRSRSLDSQRPRARGLAPSGGQSPWSARRMPLVAPRRVFMDIKDPGAEIGNPRCFKRLPVSFASQITCLRTHGGRQEMEGSCSSATRDRSIEPHHARERRKGEPREEEEAPSSHRRVIASRRRAAVFRSKGAGGARSLRGRRAQRGAGWRRTTGDNDARTAVKQPKGSLRAPPSSPSATSRPAPRPEGRLACLAGGGTDERPAGPGSWARCPRGPPWWAPEARPPPSPSP